MASSDEKKQGNVKPIPETKDAVAVALHQARETDRAPKVVASGRGNTAKQILEFAFALGFIVREDSDLAQLLSVVNEETEIPAEAFAAVAEILVYLYQANGETLPDAPSEENKKTDQPIYSVQELAEFLANKWQRSNESKS